MLTSSLASRPTSTPCPTWSRRWSTSCWRPDLWNHSKRPFITSGIILTNIFLPSLCTASSFGLHLVWNFSAPFNTSRLTFCFTILWTKHYTLLWDSFVTPCHNVKNPSHRGEPLSTSQREEPVWRNPFTTCRTPFSAWRTPFLRVDPLVRWRDPVGINAFLEVLSLSNCTNT